MQIQVGFGFLLAILITVYAYFKGVPPANIALGWIIFLVAMIVLPLLIAAVIVA